MPAAPQLSPSLELNKDKLVQMEQNSRTFIMPLMDENGTDVYGFVREFEKFIHTKKLQVLTPERLV